ncbi:MAG: PKD domain-containing protein [Flavobacteriales bacterium]
MNKLFTTACLFVALGASNLVQAQCEAFFEFETGENGLVSFINQSTPDGPAAQFLWEFGDGSISDGTNPNHEYEIAGQYQVCLYLAVFENEEMVCSDFYCTMVNVEMEATNCPFAIFEEFVGCNAVYFHLNEFPDQGNIVWNFGDGSDSGGSNNVTHTFNEPGLYEICAEAWTAECPEGVVVCTEILIEACDVPCPTGIEAEQIDCDSYIFHVTGLDDGDIMWQFGDGAGETSGLTADHTYIANGSYTVVAIYLNPNCQNPTVIYEFEIDCIQENNCPDEIWSGAGEECGVMNFEIGSFVEGEAVNWYPGDESGMVEGGHFFSHQYEEPGEYTVCAFYTSPTCNEGVELCTTIVVEECGGGECPEAIEATIIDCDSYVFHIAGVQTGNVVWQFGDGGGETSGVSADHSYAENGIYIVTAVYSGPGCPNGITLIFTVVVECGGENNCPEEIWSGAGEECGVMNFEIGSFVEGEAVNWYPGDESGMVEGGHFFSHQYEEPGEYTVCAYYTSPACPDGVQLCTTIIVEACVDCELNLTAVQTEEFSFTITATGTPEALPMHWHFGDGTPMLEATWVVDHVFAEAGPYTICAWYETEECGIQEACITVYAGEQNCPTEIIISDEINCHQFLFSVNNWSSESPYGDILWNFGDNEGYGQIDFMHMYMNPGVYEVCAEGTTDECPGGFQLCTELVVEACGSNGEGCPSYIWAWPMGECGLWHFEAGAESESANVVWNFGDGTITDDLNTIAQHQYEADGVYIVTVSIELYGDNCSESITLTHTIEVNVCEENPCDIEIWSGPGEECGVMLFEAGSFVEDEQFTWYFGDGTSEEGGHFITHQYDEPGTYIVQCVYSNAICPGWQMFTTIVVEECEETCTEIVLGLDSYVGEGGPTAAWWWIQNADGQAIDTGQAQYSENDPYYDEVICLEDGCYAIEIEGLGVANADVFSIFITQNGESIISSIEVINDNLVLVHFGVNSDCPPADECTAYFTPIYTNTPGHIEFENNSEYDGDATWLWSYGNDDTSDDQGGNVWYEENGIYVVCLTITTDNCTDTYCQEVVVTGMEGACELNTVVFTITSEYPQKGMADLIDLAIEFAGIVISDFEIVVYDGENTFEVCLPDGCYAISAEGFEGAPITASFINVEVSSDDASVNLELEVGTNSASAALGVDVECEDVVHEIAGNTFGLFPNPASGLFNLISTTTERIRQVEVTDATGRIVVSQPYMQAAIATDALASGYYMVKIIGEKHTEVIMLNIQK